jgi:hypothetical protein
LILPVDDLLPPSSLLPPKPVARLLGRGYEIGYYPGTHWDQSLKEANRRVEKMTSNGKKNKCGLLALFVVDFFFNDDVPLPMMTSSSRRLSMPFLLDSILFLLFSSFSAQLQSGRRRSEV